MGVNTSQRQPVAWYPVPPRVQDSRFPDSHPTPLRRPSPAPESNHRPDFRQSDGRPDFGPKSRPIVRRSRRKSHENQKVGSGGQGRNRTIDTRIFNPTESPVRREQAEDREGISRLADRTAPPDRAHPEPEPGIATEPGGGSMRSTGCGHRDRTFSEPRAEWDLGLFLKTTTALRGPIDSFRSSCSASFAKHWQARCKLRKLLVEYGAGNINAEYFADSRRLHAVGRCSFLLHGEDPLLHDQERDSVS